MNPSEVDKNAIAENVQRTAERATLRKVRKFTDELEDDEITRKRIEKSALALFVILAVVFALWVIYGDKLSTGKGEIVVPGHVTQPKQQ